MKPSLPVHVVLALTVVLLDGCAPVLIGAGVGAGVMVADDRRTSGTMLEDQTIEIKTGNRIRERFGENARVGITSFNRYVLLTGQAPSEEVKNEVGMLVLEVPNVRNIQNELAVSGGTSLTAHTNDGLLSTRVKGRLVQNENVSANHVKVVTESGTVYLMGLVTRAEADEAAKTAATTSGAQRVVKVFEYLD